MSASVEDRVAAGVVWLDENVPGWVGRIFLESLDLRSCSLCVLGQLFGEFESAPDAVMLDAREFGFVNVLPEDWFSAEELDAFIGAEYDALNAEWRRVILARRAEAVSIE